MADRRMWWGVGALTLGIGAALLTGPATASAEEGAGSDSSHSSSSATDHDSAKSGADTSPAQRHDAKSTPDPGSTTTGSTDRTSSTSDPGTPTTRTVTGQDPSGTSSPGTTETKPGDKPQSGSKRPQTPQRVVQVRITKPDLEAAAQNTADPGDHPSAKPTAADPVSDPPTSTNAGVSQASAPAKTDPAAPSTSDPTGLPRGPTAPHDQTPNATLSVADPTTVPTASGVDPTPTPVEVQDQVVRNVSRLLSTPLVGTPVIDPTPGVTDPTTTPVVTDPTPTPAGIQPVAALVSVDPQLVSTPDPTSVDPTDAGTPTMRFAAMQTMAAPELLSAAAPTLTTPFVPTVIQAPPTVGPIATAILDILASFGWRASPLAVWIAPALYPWSAGAAVPTPIPAVYTPSGAPPTTADYVLVGHSTLDIPCGPTTYSARVDWYFPSQDAAGTTVDPQGMIWVQNGFLANSGFYTALATNLAANTNSIVVVPTITSNPFSCFGCWLNGPSMQAGAASLFTGDRQALLNSAIAAGYTGADPATPPTLPDPFILSGHSAGGGFAAATAGDYINALQPGDPNNLRGVVMFDGVPGFGLLSSVAPLLRDKGVPIYQIAAQNQIWNIWGLGTNELSAANPNAFNGVVIYHGSHVDSMLGGNPIVDFFAQLVTKFSPPGATQAVYTFADGWINDMYAGAAPVGPPYPSPSPLYPAANQPVQVGQATAYGLPSPTGQRSTLGEIIYGIITFFSSLFGA